jgi:hypothetical protein
MDLVMTEKDDVSRRRSGNRNRDRGRGSGENEPRDGKGQKGEREIGFHGQKNRISAGRKARQKEP